jgi:hypothetical protein
VFANYQNSISCFKERYRSLEADYTSDTSKVSIVLRIESKKAWHMVGRGGRVCAVWTVLIVFFVATTSSSALFSIQQIDIGRYYFYQPLA